MHGTNVVFFGECELEWKHGATILLQERNMPSSWPHHEVHQHTMGGISVVLHLASISEQKANV
jgi:hypothetical protein